MGFPAANISLGGGELSPAVRARIDVSKVGTGASLLKNFHVLTTGGIINRSGLEYVIHALDDDTVVRLIPFEFNNAQTYVFIFQSRVMRIIKDGAILTDVDGAMTAITQANPAVATKASHGLDQDGEILITNPSGLTNPSGMPELVNRYFFVDLVLDATKAIVATTATNPVNVEVTGHLYSTGDRIYITGVGGMTELNGRTFTITVVDVDNFTLDDEDGLLYTAGSGGTAQKSDPDDFELRGEDTTSTGPYVGSSLTFEQIIDVIIPYNASKIPGLDYTQANDVLTLTHLDFPPANILRFSDTDWQYDVITLTPTIDFPTNVAVNYTGAGTGITYDWIVTAFDEETGEESISSANVTEANKDLSNTGDNAVITWDAVTDATQYNIYKAEDGSGFYGFIGSSNNLTFTDRNITPEFSDSPALSIRDPFDGVNNKPSTVAYYQARRWYAGSNNLPVTAWGSVSGNFTNFNVSKAVKDDDSVTGTISSQKANAIRHMVPLSGQLIVFTSGSEWLVTSSGTSKLITPNTIGFDVQEYWGSMFLKPITIGSVAIFVTGNNEEDENNAKFAMVRDVKYTLESDNYQGSELSVLATHLFENRDLVAWDYAQVPYSLVWAIRNDGTALTLTYVAEHKIFAWAQHETQGLYESVASVREGGEDATYFAVRRNINGTFKRMIERVHTSQFNEVDDWFGVDSGVTRDEKLVITGATQANPVVITFGTNIDDFYVNGQTIDLSDVEGMTELNGNRYTIANKTSMTVELQSDEDVPVNVDGTGFAEYFRGGISRGTITIMTGLDHLEGMEVVTLADGNVLDAQTVVDGQIDLADEYSRVHTGLSYVSDFATIDANIGDQSGVVFNNVRKVDGVTLRFFKTVGGQIGSRVEKLFDLKWRKREDWGRPGALSNGDVYAAVESRWDRIAQLFYRQKHPLPVTILSVIPEINKGDDD
jgi:hypothetical protein